METTHVLGRRSGRSILATMVAHLNGSTCGRLLCSVALALSLTSNLSAQATTGSVTGRVAEAGSGNYLQGAEITVDGSTFHTVTERDGTFSLAGLPLGKYSVTATYPGLDPLSQQVEVTSAAAASTVFTLSQGVIQLDRLVVRSSKEGMAQAVALQKISVQAKLVAAADQFGEVSEGNIGEYLKFLPGVTVDYNVNDARGISLRGLSTAFTIVAVDGTPMAGTSSIDDTRRFEFEQIAMNNVETTELFKTVTPDLPATSTGGFVNFVTKSAFDHKDIQRFDYNVSLSVPSTNVSLTKEGGVWGHNTHYLVRPSIEMNFSRKVTEKLGFNLNYRLSEKYDDSPRIEFGWNTAATVPTVITQPRLQTYNIRSEEKLTHRQSFAAKVDYKLSDSTKLMISGQWNWYDLNFTQRGPSFNLNTGATVDSTGKIFTAAANGAVNNGVLYRNKYGTTLHFNANLTHEFDNKSTLSFTPYYSHADGQYRDTTKGFISSTSTYALGATKDVSGFVIDNPLEAGVIPTITLLKGTATVPLDYIRDLGNYTLANTSTGTNVQSRPWSAVDIKDGFRLDYTLPFDSWKFPTTFQVGYALDKTKRTIDRPDYRYTVATTTGTALRGLSDPQYIRDVGYGFGSYQAIDPFKIYDYVAALPSTINIVDARTINESNDAAYLRADVKVTPDLLLVGGFRYEKRDMTAIGRTGSPARARTATSDLNFDSLYPSINFKYTPKRNIVLRGGASQTIGIPDYAEILPIFTASSTSTASDGTFSVPAGNLKPYRTTNLDLNFDYYLKNSGVATVSVFRKYVSDYIMSTSMTAQQMADTATQYGLNLADYGTTAGVIRENGPATQIQGIELSYSQNLSFLPSPFNGLSFQANYTYTDISASSPDKNRENDALINQSRAVSPQTVNVILGYRYKKVNVTLTNNWVSESEFGGFVNTGATTGTANIVDRTKDTRFVLFRDEKNTVDIKVEYAINKHVSAYFLVRNVLNSPRIDYMRGYLPENSNIVLPYRYYEFGEPHLTLGFRGRF